jgi:hypothetical protein
MNAWLFALVCLIVTLIVLMVFIPVADEVLGTKCISETTGLPINCFDATTTILLEAMGILVIVAMLWAIFRRFNNDLDRESY